MRDPAFSLYISFFLRGVPSFLFLFFFLTITVIIIISSLFLALSLEIGNNFDTRSSV